MINTNKISVIKIKDKIDDKSIYMVWNKNIIHNKNKMEFKNYALNMEQKIKFLGLYFNNVKVGGYKNNSLLFLFQKMRGII